MRGLVIFLIVYIPMRLTLMLLHCNTDSLSLMTNNLGQIHHIKIIASITDVLPRQVRCNQIVTLCLGYIIFIVFVGYFQQPVGSLMSTNCALLIPIFV
jgi:hypothetical protein